MTYVAKTNGATSGEPLEIKEGTILDIPLADRDNWRDVTVVLGAHDPVIQKRVYPDLVIENDGSVTMSWPNQDSSGAWKKHLLKKYAAQVRWQKTQEPLILPDGTVVDASDYSKNRIHQILTVLDKGWVPSVSFKAKSGWVVVDLAAMTGISQAMVAKEQSLFIAEENLAALIEAGTITTKSEIDNWPSWPS